MKTLSDNPGATTGVLGAFIAAVLSLAISFGVHLTDQQVSAILLVLATGSAAAAWVLSKVSVAKTPSSTAAPLQVPPPTTVLVTQAAAAAHGPVPDSAIVASPAPPQA